MTTLDLEKERYSLIGGAINPRSHRNVKSMLLLQRDGVKFIAWSFDGKQYTIPKIVDNGEFKKCLAKKATQQYDAATVKKNSNAISAYC